MLEKIIVPHDFGQPQVGLIHAPERFGAKCASENARTCGKVCTAKSAALDLVDFVNRLEPDPKYMYLHIIALGSGEFFGPNSNGDFFPEGGLVKKHRTFQDIARLFKHHINKNPERSYGRPVFSTYNNPMHRVELVVAVDKEKAPDIVQRAEHGGPLAFSMSCKIPWDLCSICGNRARKKSEYCSHIRNQLLEILPDGRQVCMINPDPNFFDISYVIRPADKTAMMLSKIASQESIPEIESISKPCGKPKKEKVSSIKKEIDIILTPALPDEDREKFRKYAMPRLVQAEPDLPVDNLAKYSLRDILSTLTACGIICRPEEYNKLLILNVKRQPTIRKIEDALQCGCFSVDVYSHIKDVVPLRSFFNPHFIVRLEKIAGEYYVNSPDKKREDKREQKKLLSFKNIAIGGAATYAAYKTEIGRKIREFLEDMIRKRPGKFLLLTGLGAGAAKLAPLITGKTVTDSIAPDFDNYAGSEGILLSEKHAFMKKAIQPYGALYFHELMQDGGEISR